MYHESERYMLFVLVITLPSTYPKENLGIEDVLFSVVYSHEKLEMTRTIWK